MIHTDGEPTIAMRESEIVPLPYGDGTIPETNYYKEYRDLGDAESHFLLVEVEGDAKNAMDLRSLIEKLEFSGLGITAIMSLEEMHSRHLL